MEYAVVMEYAKMREEIIKVLPKTGGMTLNEILEKLNGERSLFDSVDEKLVKDVLRTESKNPKSCIVLCSKKRKGRNAYRIRTATPGGPRPETTKPGSDTDDTNYIGKAGEFAVLTELVARGYNASTMTIDEGIDIVASKENIFYYVQVKTTYMYTEGRKVMVHIPKSNFDRVERHNVLYFVAVRMGIGAFEYFVLSQRDIKREIKNGYIDESETNINIKIAYDDKTNEPYLYNGRERTSARAYKLDEETRF